VAAEVPVVAARLSGRVSPKSVLKKKRNEVVVPGAPIGVAHRLFGIAKSAMQGGRRPPLARREITPTGSAWGPQLPSAKPVKQNFACKLLVLLVSPSGFEPETY
jgi:hypothetical protein